MKNLIKASAANEQTKKIIKDKQSKEEVTATAYLEANFNTKVQEAIAAGRFTTILEIPPEINSAIIITKVRNLGYYAKHTGIRGALVGSTNKIQIWWNSEEEDDD